MVVGIMVDVVVIIIEDVIVIVDVVSVVNDVVIASIAHHHAQQGLVHVLLAVAQPHAPHMQEDAEQARLLPGIAASIVSEADVEGSWWKR